MVELVDEVIFETTVTESFTDNQVFDFTTTLPGGDVVSITDLLYVEQMFINFSMDSINISKPNNQANTFTLEPSDVSISFGNNFTISIDAFTMANDSGTTDALTNAPPVDASQSQNITVDRHLGDGLSVGDLTINATTTNNEGRFTFNGNQDIDFEFEIVVFGRKP